MEPSLPAVPGMSMPVKYLCVAPFGMEEGTGGDISGQSFGLIVGEQVKFDLYASNTRKQDEMGLFAATDPHDISLITTMETQLDMNNDNAGTMIPIQLQVLATEIGTLEVWCASHDNDQKWKLEFNVRQENK